MRLTILSAMCLSLCGCLPASLRIDQIDDPRGNESKVRFRTVYYYRVFDYCTPLQPSVLSNGPKFDPLLSPDFGTYFVLSDSLYRFTMTGRAGTAFTQTRFESGVLKADQIDPFGNSVSYDDKRNQFYVQSREATQAERELDSVHGEIDRMLELREKLGAKSPKEKPIDGVIATLDAQLSIAIRSISPVGVPETAEPVVTPVSEPLERQAELVSLKTTASIAEKALLPLADMKPYSYNLATIRNQKLRLEANPDVDAEVLQDIQINLQEAIESSQAVAEAKIRKEKENLKTLVPGEKERIDNLSQSTDFPQFILEVTKGRDQIAVKSVERSAQIIKDRSDVQQKLDVARSRVVNPVNKGRRPGTGEGTTCPIGTGQRRGFQIFGPEGWKTFNQDDRLIMAMYSTGRPLTDLLTDFSSRVQAASINSTGNALAFSQERLHTLEALWQLNAVGPGPEDANRADKVLDNLIKQFDATGSAAP